MIDTQDMEGIISHANTSMAREIWTDGGCRGGRFSEVHGNLLGRAVSYLGIE